MECYVLGVEFGKLKPLLMASGVNTRRLIWRRLPRFISASSLWWLIVAATINPLAQTAPDATDQSTPVSCFSSQIVSVPSRPTVSNAADTTHCGVLEAEYGLERQWPGAGALHDDLTGGLRLGLTPKLDFHWSSVDFLRLQDASGGSQIGFADTWLGVKYHFLEQSKTLPGLGIFYQVKIPSSNQGLSTGKVDQSFSFLVSRDIKPVHFDFNVIGLLAGRQSGSGMDHDVGFALSGSVPLKHGVSFVGEGYGYTRLNESSPAFGSAMGGLTYQISPRLILDSGLDVGVTHDAPKKRVYVGITYAIGNVYGWMKRK